ncbi:MAG TPA: hypothetical protein VG873_10000 [Burkholderiales bacterium]|nr:hypothetical protein [Burkholderiales bacterium]
MRAIAPVLLCAALTAGACSHVDVAVNSTTAAPGTVSQGGSVHARASGGAALLLLGAVAIAAGDFSEDRPSPDPRDLFSPSPSSSRAAPMAPDRRINEQDCTRPVDFTAGNLRCR